jgi:hypothetical protein
MVVKEIWADNVIFSGIAENRVQGKDCVTMAINLRIFYPVA